MPYGASLAFAPVMHLRLPSDNPSRDRMQTAIRRSGAPEHALATSVSGSLPRAPGQDLRVYNTRSPPISSDMPNTPGLRRCAPPTGEIDRALSIHRTIIRVMIVGGGAVNGVARRPGPWCGVMIVGATAMEA